MERFLKQCANYILEGHKTDLKDVCLIFPNRRSGVFFTQYLQEKINAPVIGPKTTTVNELISSYTDLHKGEKLQLISILFDVFCKHTKTTETFDEFYFWGEILLADFNDIDRYLISAKDIFTNISDLKEIESVFDYLTKEQKKALEQFWGSIAVKDKKGFQEKYTSIWDKLYLVYAGFKKELEKTKLAFPGMIDRNVVENLDSGEYSFPFKKYYIIGLNALNNCEKKFFTHLQRIGKAEFIWDYDNAYLEDWDNEAGLFLRNNLNEFPQPDGFHLNTKLFNQPKHVKLIAASSVSGQAQQIPIFLEETKANQKKVFDNTAVILADESLLFSAMGAIPDNIKTVNVTMGYSVRNSAVYGFLSLLVALLKNKRKEENGIVAYHKYVTDILNHQLLGNSETEKSKAYITEVKLKNRITIKLKEINFSPIHQQVFNVPENVVEFSSYFLKVLEVFYTEYREKDTTNAMLLELIFSIYQAIERLDAVVGEVINKQNREINEGVYFRLFTQYIGQVSVAFEGEPLSGLQVMGILETRCLDFENIIILGLNENKWPRKYTTPSFIPFNIRKGFGLPGIDEQDAMYAYYFYRIIQRAKNVTGTYSVVKEGIGTGELSRYGYQLQYDSVHKPEMLNLDFVFENDPEQTIKVGGSRYISQKLLSNNSLSHPLSPSAINAYLHCSLKFYFRYVVGLPEPDEVKEEIDGVVFGNIFHDTLEELYKPLVGKVVNKSDIENMLQNRVGLENEVTRQIAIHYLKKKMPSKGLVRLHGKTLLIFENSITYLKQLLRFDLKVAPFSIVSLEEKYKRWIDIELDSVKKSICIGGKVDRVDRLNGQLRVLDYKTGNVKGLSFKKIDDLFNKEIKEPKKEILQALIYCWGLSENMNSDAIQPVIYSLKSIFKEDFSPNILCDNKEVLFEDVKEDFELNLKQLVAEIYGGNNSFLQTEHKEKCQYCAYSGICRRY